MPPTKMKYGRESTPASHWIYKVLDLNKKHTRKYFMFEDEDVAKKTSQIDHLIDGKFFPPLQNQSLVNLIYVFHQTGKQQIF